MKYTKKEKKDERMTNETEPNRFKSYFNLSNVQFSVKKKENKKKFSMF